MVQILFFLLKLIFYFVCTFLPFLISVAFFTLGERKLLGAIQRREGPAVVGFWGLLQPIADALKLIFKEIVLPFKSNILLFISAPIVLFSSSIFSMAVLIYNVNAIYSNVNLGLLYLLTVSSLGVYGLVLAGWSSNSRYSFLGSLRSMAQMISYEIVFGIVILCVVITAQSFSLLSIIHAQYKVFFLFPLFPAAILFLIMALAESNRTPFDLSEAEAELVAGYNTEYSSIIFALFFLAEYANMLILAFIFSYLFLGGWLPVLNFDSFFSFSCEFWLSLKVTVVCILFVLIRGFLPRYRYDQLMGLGWGVFLPFSFVYLFFLMILYINFECDYRVSNHHNQVFLLNPLLTHLSFDDEFFRIEYLMNYNDNGLRFPNNFHSSWNDLCRLFYFRQEINVDFFFEERRVLNRKVLMNYYNFYKIFYAK